MGIRLSFQIQNFRLWMLCLLWMDGFRCSLLGNAAVAQNFISIFIKKLKILQKIQITMLIAYRSRLRLRKSKTRALLERPPLRYLFIPPLCVKVGEIVSQC